MRKDGTSEATGLDRLTKSAAVAISRRGFLKRMSSVGAALGLGLGLTSTTSAAENTPDCIPADPWTERRCVTCSTTRARLQTRTCRYTCTGSVTCGTWYSYTCGSC